MWKEKTYYARSNFILVTGMYPDADQKIIIKKDDIDMCIDNGEGTILYCKKHKWYGKKLKESIEEIYEMLK